MDSQEPTSAVSKVLAEPNLLQKILGLLVPADRRRASLVGRAWHRAEGATRRSLGLKNSFPGGAAAME
jgi:hypothetical protein